MGGFPFVLESAGRAAMEETIKKISSLNQEVKISGFNLSETEFFMSG